MPSHTSSHGKMQPIKLRETGHPSCSFRRRLQMEPLEARDLLAGDAADLCCDVGEHIRGVAAEIARVGQHLTLLYDEYVQHQARPDGELVDFQPSNPLLHVVEDHVLIEAVATGDARQLQVQLEELGLHVTGTFGPMVSGKFPIDAIDDLVALEHLNFARAVLIRNSDGTNLQPLPGDANLDGVFDQKDIVQVLQSGKYNTGQPADRSEGDWNGDGRFDQFDVIAALQTGQYLQPSPPAVAKSDALFATDWP